MKNTYVLSIKHCKLFRHCQFETDSSFSVNDFSIRVHCNLTCTHCCNSIMLYCIDNLYATNTNCTFLHNKCPITNEKWLCFTLLTITDTVEYYCVLICTLTVSWSLHWLNAINNVIILHSNHTSTLETCAGTHCCSHSHPSWQFYFPHPQHFFPHPPLTHQVIPTSHPIPSLTNWICSWCVWYRIKLQCCRVQTDKMQ